MYVLSTLLLIFACIGILYTSNLNAVYVKSISDKDNALIKAINDGDVKKVKSLIKSGFDVSKKSEYGQTALMAAAYYGNVEIIRLLIAAGADLEICDDNGDNAFMCTFYDSEKKAAVEYFLSLNVDINKINNYHLTPLILAAFNNHCQSIELLISNGAEIELKGKDGASALIHAVNNKNFEATIKLILLGANIETRDQWSFTPLMVAAFNDDGEMLKVLLEAGSNIATRTTQTVRVEIKKSRIDFNPTIIYIPKDSSALDIAKILNKDAAVKVLIEAGA